jgi:hypothetical protein
MYKVQSENNRKSGRSWVRNNWCYLPTRAKLWTAEATVSYYKTIWGQLSPASVPSLLSNGVSLQQDNARSHTANATMMTWRHMKFEVLPHTLLIPQTWRRLIFICLDHWKSPCGDVNSTSMMMSSRRYMSGSRANHNSSFLLASKRWFPLAQVLWTAGGLCWIVSRYFLRCLSKPHCSTTFPVIFWLSAINSNNYEQRARSRYLLATSSTLAF